jgi:hypothetical protein
MRRWTSSSTVTSVELVSDLYTDLSEDYFRKRDFSYKVLWTFSGLFLLILFGPMFGKGMYYFVRLTGWPDSDASTPLVRLLLLIGVLVTGCATLYGFSYLRAVYRSVRAPRGKYSPWSKTATLTVKGELDEVARECRRGLMAIGAEPITFSFDQCGGSILAAIGPRSVRYRDLLVVKIQITQDGCYRLRITGDGVYPTFIADQARHMTNVSRLVNEITRLSNDINSDLSERTASADHAPPVESRSNR